MFARKILYFGDILYFLVEGLVDVLIIGAGFTGLVAGALISRKCETVIVEKNSFVGGRAATRTPKEWRWCEVDNYLVDFGHHVFATNNYLEWAIRQTGAERFFKKILISMPYFYKNEGFHKSPVSFLEKLRAYPFLPLKSKLKINSFLKYVEKVSYSEVESKWFYRPLRDLYDEFGFDEYARELFTDGFAAGYQTVTYEDKNSAGDLILCMKAFLKGIRRYRTPIFGAEYGVGKNAEAFKKVIEENRGSVMLGKRVKKIKVKNGVVEGVILDDGKFIKAKRVLLSAPVYNLLNLVDNLPSDYAERLMEARKHATYLFLIYGGAKRPLLSKPIGTWVLIPKTEVRNINSYYLVYEVDTRMKQAPNNRYLVSFATMPKIEELKNRDTLMKKMEDDMSRVFPEFNFERDLEWKVGVYFPIVDALERTIDFYYEKRFGPETPIKNLFVAGDSAHELSSGVDGCASSAIFASEKILGEKLIDLEEFYKIS